MELLGKTQEKLDGDIGILRRRVAVKRRAFAVPDAHRFAFPLRIARRRERHSSTMIAYRS
jgi:hypothetical protein